jgi:hypothetical protein
VGRPHDTRETPAKTNCHIRSARLLETGIVAVQKVEGSNPFSRFFENSLHVGGLVPARVAEIK